MGLAVFMASPVGRIARIVAGVVLIILGFVVGGAAGWALGIVGLVPIAAGAGNMCLLGAPFKGSEANK